MTSYIVTFSRILMLAIKMCSRNLSFIIKGKNKSFSSILLNDNLGIEGFLLLLLNFS